MRCRTQSISQLKPLLIVMPAQLRETLKHLDTAQLVKRCLERNEEEAINPLTAAWMAMRFFEGVISHMEQKLMALGRHSIGNKQWCQISGLPRALSLTTSLPRRQSAAVAI